MADSEYCLNILPLTDVPAVISRLAEWHQTQHSVFGRETTLAECEERLRPHLGSQAVPCTFVALCHREPVGSASLVAYQPTPATRPSHWLANLYVGEAHRRRGIGTRLIGHIQRYAAHQGLARLHLFTTDQKAFYLRRRWVWVRRSHLRGQGVDIMRIELLQG